MSNFNNSGDRGNFRSGGRDRSFGGGRRDDRGGSDREMFEAVCDECGKNCKVPFKPTSGKPIYCSECFEKKGGREDRGGSRGGSFGGNRGGSFGGSRGGSFGGARRDDRGGNRGGSFGGRRDDVVKDNSSEKIEALGSRLNKVFELLEEIKDRQIKMEGSCNCITEESPKKATKKKVAVKKAEVKADKKAEKKAKKVVKKVAKK
ncbi:hypothetical protein K9L04_01210 [Patescibacteria group bacterium]|nr:hypothetical protein [Patescibacteria group bacterium]